MHLYAQFISPSSFLFLLLTQFSLLLTSCNSIETKNGHVIKDPQVGAPIDSLNGVKVYYNGSVGNVEGRNVVDGYNIGQKYQCVEFVKRYYFEYYDHRMPETYGHAKSFFIPGVTDGQMNTQRNLKQFTNPSGSMPCVGDLIVKGATIFNSYGHVAIISEVKDDHIEIIQQNPGPTASSRVEIGLEKKENKWFIDDEDVLGWLRK